VYTNIMFIEVVVVVINLVVPLLTLFLGGLLGNQFALGRDKRKEHNAVVLPLKQKVLAYIDELKQSRHLNFNFNESEIKTLRGVISEQKYNQVKGLYCEFVGLIRKHSHINKAGYIIYSEVAKIEISRKLKEIDVLLSLK
jgi:hypothetical protein